MCPNIMDKVILDSLKILGLSSKEIKFLETSLKLGPATINQVAKVSRLQRSTAYLIAEELIKTGFLEEDLKSYKKKVYAIEPKKLLQIIANKQRQLRRQELELEENLPALEAFYSKSQIRPKVKVYEGNQGLLAVWKDILSTKNEILVWTNQQTDKLVFGPTKHINFIEERVKKGIPARVLAVGNLEGRKLKDIDSQNLRQTRILPAKTNFSAESYIYDNKIAILDYKKDIIGIIIESEPIAKSYKEKFELVWGLIP